MKELKVGGKIKYDRFLNPDTAMKGVLVEFGTIRGVSGAWVVCKDEAYFSPLGKIYSDEEKP